jgi:two-component system, sensor histidine kinase and response regulator
MIWMPSDMVLLGSYDHSLVALSVFIAILAAYAALDLAGRVSSSEGGARFLWLTGGAVAMGIGIWSMHYVGMLAYQLPVPVQYHWPTVLLSLLAAIFASAVSLFVVSRQKMGISRASIGSVFMGGGIGAMHYVGMAAMRVPAMHHYSTFLVSVSLVLAIVISFVAIWLTFHLRGDTAAWGWRKVLSALVMGLAIPVMHYTGMAAASFTPTDLPVDMIGTLSVSAFGTAGIIVVTFMVLALVLVTSLADRRFSVQTLQLEANADRYHRILDTAFDAFVEFDTSGLITDWSAQAELSFGWSRSEAIGQPISQVIVVQGVQQWSDLVLSDAALSGDRQLKRRAEVMALHRDKHEFAAELTISEIRFGGKDLFAAFVRDVADRKRADDERERAKEAAEAASRAKSEFLANMSHEIRTPLNGVVGMTDLALETELTSEQREYMETVKVSADSLLTVINDILDFSKIEAGKIDLEPDDFNLRDSLEMTLKTLSTMADKKGLELLCEIDARVPEVVRGDSNRLRQIVVNLLGNAIKFTHEGEVALNVQVESEGDGHRLVHFTVSDTGIGIDPQKQKSIFQPFSQADSSTTRKYGGTGLGLTISARLVRIMGGDIWVESQVGRGSRFHFTVRLETAEKPVEPDTIAPPELLRGVKVLVVDDNRTNRRILEGMLKRWEMVSASAEDGEQALVMLAAALNEGKPYSLVLTDMHMPKMDGFDLIERIRRRPELSSAVIMMLTSAGHRGDGARCQALGVAAYLLKPIRQSELREAVARSLGARERKGPIPLVTRYSLHDAQEPGSSLRVLVAEDNPVNQLLATRLLEKRGHRVALAANGREALEALEKETYDLVLMDMQMPDMDGFEATATIRQKEKQQGGGVHQPVVALTAYAMKDDQERCLAAGVDGYLTKPIQADALNAMLETYVARRIAAEKTLENRL